MAVAMRLYRTASGAVVEADGRFHRIGDPWDGLIDRADLSEYLGGVAAAGRGESRLDDRVLAPVGAQEVWAAGVTYVRSRAARMEESKDAGGGAFYDRVYEAVRPELFFKAPGWRVRGPGEPVRVRGDSKWSVPEPEMALCVNARGEIVGYTIGNDMSARDLEGENPLYLPQAKVYDGSCALGPALRLGAEPPPPDTTIRLEIGRAGKTAFAGETTLAKLRRTPAELVSYLYRETSFPQGCVLLTGTGIVPPDDFTLEPGDEIRIEIGTLGRLVNSVG
jgi:2-dehydro-3-deoxy-D-arabinonate dehydratase